MTRDELAVLLDRLAPQLKALVEPWTVIGSAALILAGASRDECADVDILTTETGAEILQDYWTDWLQGHYTPDWLQGHYTPDPDGPFRSRFSRYDFAPGAVEVMGGLKVRKDAAWRSVVVHDQMSMPFGAHRWPVPTVAEQVRMLKLFGRTKDLEKVQRLQLSAEAARDLGEGG